MVGGLAELCDEAGLAAADLTGVFHGTTVATNAVLEHDGALTGMITTRGFRDIVHIGRHQRPLHYSVLQDIPWQAHPFVRRRHRKVVTERIVPLFWTTDYRVDLAGNVTASIPKMNGALPLSPPMVPGSRVRSIDIHSSSGMVVSSGFPPRTTTTAAIPTMIRTDTTPRPAISAIVPRSMNRSNE